MLLNLDFEILRLIVAYLSVKELKSLYETCKRTYRFFRLESARPDCIYESIRVRELVMKMIVQGFSSDFRLILYNKSHFNSEFHPISLFFSPTQEDIQDPNGIIQSQNTWECSGITFIGDSVIHTKENFIRILCGKHQIIVDKYAFIRLFREYSKIISQDSHRQTGISIFKNRSVLISHGNGLFVDPRLT